MNGLHLVKVQSLSAERKVVFLNSSLLNEPKKFVVRVFISHFQDAAAGSDRVALDEKFLECVIEVHFFVFKVGFKCSRGECFFAMSALKPSNHLVGSFDFKIAFSMKNSTANGVIGAVGIRAKSWNKAHEDRGRARIRPIEAALYFGYKSESVRNPERNQGDPIRKSWEKYNLGDQFLKFKCR